jgi:hypothetical protein
MRWVIALGLIAACGRIGFDPSGAGDGGGGGSSTTGGGTGDVDAPGGGGAASAHYITGGSASQQLPIGTISTTTGPLNETDMVVVVAIHWEDATSSVTTVLDTFGNGFTTATSMTRHNAAQSQIMWFKRVTEGITITVLFDQPAPEVDIKWAAYRDIAQTATIGGSAGESGTSAIADTGGVSVSGPAVLVASSASQAADAGAGPGYAERHKGGGGVLEDRDVTAPGIVNATATLSAADDWIIQVVALRPR